MKKHKQKRQTKNGVLNRDLDGKKQKKETLRQRHKEERQRNTERKTETERETLKGYGERYEDKQGKVLTVVQ